MKAPKIPLKPKKDIVEHTLGVLEDVQQRLEAYVGKVSIDYTFFRVEISSDRLLPLHEDCTLCSEFRPEVQRLYGRVLELLEVVKQLPDGRVREQMTYELRALVGELYKRVIAWTFHHLQKEATKNEYRSPKNFYVPS